jgi:phosphinothricin acetyltransferase
MIELLMLKIKSSITFHEKFGFTTAGIIKDSGFKFDRWLHSVFMQLILE